VTKTISDVRNQVAVMEEEMSVFHMNGWQRLWVVSSAIWLVLVACERVTSFSEGFHSIDEIQPHLTSESLNILKRSKGSIKENVSLERYAFLPEDETSKPESTHHINYGVKLNIRPGTPVYPNRRVVSQEYIDKTEVEAILTDCKNIEKQMNEKIKFEYIINSSVLGIVPCGILYLLGTSIAWVYRGFKRR